jgi:hypothetical protein
LLFLLTLDLTSSRFTLIEPALCSLLSIGVIARSLIAHSSVVEDRSRGRRLRDPVGCRGHDASHVASERLDDQLAQLGVLADVFGRQPETILFVGDVSATQRADLRGDVL